MTEDVDYTFRAMGSDVRLLIGRPFVPHLPAPLDAAERESKFVLAFAHRLSRFIPDSELSALNRDRRSAVPASELLRAAVRAGLWAAERSGGLVDPTLVRALRQNGYAKSMDGAVPASLRQALDAAPPRRRAHPDPRAQWRRIKVNDERGMIVRPPGLMIDTGGTGKGLCADAVAYRLGGYSRFVVDCGGDVAIGGIGTELEPYRVEVEHPITGRSIGSILVARGGVATSGLNVRIWRDRRGRFAHHLLDPSTGLSAWTGLISATALGSSALDAETRSKLALLRGPAGAREVLGERGGVIVHDGGEIERVGPIELAAPAAMPALPAAAER